MCRTCGQEAVQSPDREVAGFTLSCRWSIENVVGSGDDLYLVTVTPWEDYTADASRILQECYDYAHNAGQ